MSQPAFLLRRTVTLAFYPKKKYRKEIILVSDNLARLEAERARLMNIERAKFTKRDELTGVYRRLLDAHRQTHPLPTLPFAEGCAYRREEDALLMAQVKEITLRENPAISEDEYATYDPGKPLVADTFKIIPSAFLD